LQRNGGHASAAATVVMPMLRAATVVMPMLRAATVDVLALQQRWIC
jgi:hypothetical protein